MTTAVITLAIALFGVVTFLVYREWYHSKHIETLEKRYFDERQMLLDRLMARNFIEYKQGEVATKMQEQLNKAAQLAQQQFEDDDMDWVRVGE